MTSDGVGCQTVWPLAGLEVMTPRLSLRYITDDLGVELALLAAEGIHDPATMPFSTPWTDVPSPELERNTLRFYWRNRADTTVEHWDLNLAVVVDGAARQHCIAAGDPLAALHRDGLVDPAASRAPGHNAGVRNELRAVGYGAPQRH